MTGYVPRERYHGRAGPRPSRLNPSTYGERVRQWRLALRYGAVYDLADNTSRPATPEEFAGRKKLKVFPDDFKELKKVKTGYWRRK